MLVSSLEGTTASWPRKHKGRALPGVAWSWAIARYVYYETLQLRIFPAIRDYRLQRSYSGVFSYLATAAGGVLVLLVPSRHTMN